MKSIRLLTAAFGLCGAFPAHAQTTVQTVEFNFTENYNEAAATTFTHVGSSFFTGSFAPFDASLGTLDSFVVSWNLANAVDGTFGGSGGSVLIELDGGLTLNGISYTTVRNGNSRGGAPGSAVAYSVPTISETTFLVSAAGETYDPRLLDAVAGATSFGLSYASPVTVQVSGSAVFDVITSGAVSLTYNYTASAVPEPASGAMLLGGFAGMGAMMRRRRRPALRPSDKSDGLQ